MQSKNRLYLTKDGYSQLLDKIEEIQLKLNENGMSKKIAYEEAPGDGWHDNFVYEDLIRVENNLLAQLQNLLKQKDNVVLIERKKINNEEFVDIGDFIELEFIYNDDSKEKEVFELNANYFTKHEQEISINSTLGQAVYLKKVNSTVSYHSNNQTIKVNIIKKCHLY